jgi:CHAT domain-containing protein
MALMNSLYEKLLVEGLPKAKALQQAQIAMIQQVRFLPDSKELYLDDDNIRDLPTQVVDSQDFDSNYDLSIPYFWSGFNLAGNPW